MCPKTSDGEKTVSEEASTFLLSFLSSRSIRYKAPEMLMEKDVEGSRRPAAKTTRFYGPHMRFGLSCLREMRTYEAIVDNNEKLKGVI